MKKFIWLFIPIFLSATPSQKLINELKNLSDNQITTLLYVFRTGGKENLAYTLTAIVWQESVFGKYMINIKDPSCGLTHIKLDTVALSKWNQSRLCEELQINDDKALKLAIDRLKFFISYWQKKGLSYNLAWKRAIMSYNAGYRYWYGKKYYKKIKDKIKTLKWFISNPHF